MKNADAPYQFRTWSYDGPTERLWRLVWDEPYGVILDSNSSDTREDSSRGRYTFLACRPVAVVHPAGEGWMKDLRRIYEPVSRLPECSLSPLPTGVLGYIAYDAGLYGINLPSRKKAFRVGPDCVAGLYDPVITVDHVSRKVHVISSGIGPDFQRNDALARERIDEWSSKIESFLDGQRAAPEERQLNAPGAEWVSNFSRREYCRAVEQALRAIGDGEIYQVNLSQRFRFCAESSRVSPGVYESLRRVFPTFFGGFFRAGDHCLLSASPERFFQTGGGRVLTQPMKGTKARGSTPDEDRRFREEFSLSVKDRAELLMITDLLRNDLGRVCEYGSVRVHALRAIETYETVFQAVSTVEGILREGLDGWDVMEACFPGGSITGCPKVRAMQIINELEPTPRGAYTGTMGYAAPQGRMDWNILIRTLVIRGHQWDFQTGGGIVADSTPEGEYEETLLKAEAFRRSLDVILKEGGGHQNGKL